MDLMDLVNEAQERLNEATYLMCELINTGSLDPDQIEDAERIIRYLDAIKNEFVGFS